MIKKLEIKNFKSVKHLKFNCKRINIFIGEPNTGKSNILESLGMFSFGSYGGNIKNFVRLEKISNLFYDENLDDNIKIKIDDDKILEIKFKDGNFTGEFYKEKKEIGRFVYNHDGGSSITPILKDLFFIKFYKFIAKERFLRKESDFLLPPSGENLLTTLQIHKELKSIVTQIFDRFGLKLIFKPQDDKIEILKQYEDIFISYPYSLASETLQRVIFYLTAIDSNKNSVLIFEEPETHAFPYYTKHLAEIISFNKNNQYFISTHNPYFLLSVIEKSPKDDFAIFITYFDNYQTKIKLLTEKGKKEILESEVDVFFNIERFLEEK